MPIFIIYGAKIMVCFQTTILFGIFLSIKMEI